ncbi:MAG: hypothetical protein AB7U83_14525 [Vicinamibacterales bacterium]
MPYLRLTADRRGVENTFLVHNAAPGAPPRVLYWYRTAPGLRIGRPALDDGAMRMLEEQYPDIDFDWPYILDMGAMTPVEVEAPLPPRKRKPRRPESEEGTDETAQVAAVDLDLVPPAGGATAALPPPTPDTAPDALPEPSGGGPDLLAELLGRGIAASLRARHQQLVADVQAAAWTDPAARAALEARLAAIDPDSWTTADSVLTGMARIDAEVEAVRQALG